MSLAFSRSLRALHNDRFRPALVGLALALLTLAAWGFWFVAARVTLYESSRAFEVQRDGQLAVHFSPEARARLQPGQAAVFLPEDGAAAWPALVMDVPHTGAIPVYIAAPESPAPGLAGEVRVEVARVSPLMLVLRAAGQFPSSDDR